MRFAIMNAIACGLIGALLSASVGQAIPHHSFSLRDAHRAAQKLLEAYPHHVGVCRWASLRVAACPGTVGPVVIVNGSTPIRFSFTVLVERGSCRVTSGTDAGQCDTIGPLAASISKVRETP